LGRTLARTIEDNGLRPFFAQDVHSAGDLNSEVFKAIQTCDAFLGILQKRGVVTYAGFPPVERSSVWIQQEIAVFCYRMFLEQRSLPIRVFSERGILREGVIQIAIVNPIEFDRSTDVVSGVDAWLKSRDFEEHPVMARREELFRQRIQELSNDAELLLELIAAHCPEPGDFVQHNVLSGDFSAVLIAGRITEPHQITTRFNDAWAMLINRGLTYTDDNARSVARVSIVKQWWQLVLDELRNRGRRV